MQPVVQLGCISKMKSIAQFAKEVLTVPVAILLCSSHAPLVSSQALVHHPALTVLLVGTALLLVPCPFPVILVSILMQVLQAAQHALMVTIVKLMAHLKLAHLVMCVMQAMPIALSLNAQLVIHAVTTLLL